MTKISLDDFEKDWEEQISKIENRTLDNYAASMIRIHFDLTKTKLKMFLSEDEIEQKDAYLRLDMLESKLEVALATANCRFTLQNRGIWARAFNGFLDKIGKKVPE